MNLDMHLSGFLNHLQTTKITAEVIWQKRDAQAFITKLSNIEHAVQMNNVQLHPSCIIPAQQRNVAVRIKNTLDPDAPGTLITSEKQPDNVKAIAVKDGITAIKIKSTRMVNAYGFLRKIFEVFEKYRTPIDMITTSEIAVSLTIDNPAHLHPIIDELRPFGIIEVDQEQSIICIVGDFVAEKKGIVTDIFTSLENIPVRMISYGGSRNNISVLIDTNYKKEALQSLNQGLFNL